MDLTPLQNNNSAERGVPLMDVSFSLGGYDDSIDGTLYIKSALGSSYSAEFQE